jgi:predicted MPP superfamily phosphohydrolase
MTLLIVHLSDIHFKENGNHILSKEEQVFAAINSQLTSDIKQIFCTITGDIAFSGNEKEYEVAYDFLAKFKEHIQKKIHFVFCPGNHDCDFSTTDTTREVIVEKCLNNPEKSFIKDAIKNCCQAQKNFNNFRERIEDSDSKDYMIPGNELLQVKKYYILNGGSLTFHCYNTAWCSLKSESKSQVGKKIFPIHYVEQLIREDSNDLTISIFHHPYNWLTPKNMRDFREFVERSSDIVLTGHEHSERNIKTQDLSSQKDCFLLQGAVFQNTTDENDSGFKIIKLNIEEKIRTGTINSFIWNKEKQRYSRESIDIALNKIVSTTWHGLKKDFINQLQDIKVSLTHRNIEEIKLKDIFIYPYLKKINEDSNKIDSEIKADQIANISDISNRKIIFAGAEQSGKTALCNMLFLHYYDKGFIPVFLHKINLNNVNDKNFNKAIQKAYNEQYDGEYEAYEQLNTKNKILIIDNLNHLKLSEQYKLVKICKNYFENIIITTDDIFKFARYNKQEACPIDDFLQFEILKLGHLARSELIKKWITLGNEYDEDTMIKHEDELTNLVNSIILKNVIPRYPIFILTILQTYEMASPSDYNNTCYGYCYMSLIIYSFHKINIPSQDINALYIQYLTHLSYCLFASDKIELSEDDLTDFKNNYGKKYPVFYTQDTIINNLISSKIIYRSALGNYKFKYKYFYYFFVAKYLAEHIDEKPIKDTIIKLCKKIHISKFANILIFLIYHSKKSFILDEIMFNMMTLFENNNPAKLLKEEVSFISDFLNLLPQIILENKNVIEERRKKLIVNDEIDKDNEVEEKKREEIEYEIPFKNNQDENLDEIAQLNQAFKSLEIIGQILKNHWGSIEIEKQKELISEAYETGLRTLNFFLELSEKLENDIKNMIKDWLETNGLSDEKAQKKASHFFTAACYYASFGTIHKIAGALGFDRLTKIYQNVCKEYNTPAINLIDLSIEMQFRKTIPIERLKKLKKEFSSTKNIFAERMLQEIVIRHLYMHRIKDKDKQKISAILDISIKGQRSIEFKAIQKVLPSN